MDCEVFGTQLSEYKTRKLFKVLDHLMIARQYDKVIELCELVKKENIHHWFSPHRFHRFFMIEFNATCEKKDK